jgi:hypothetical protein
MPQAAQKSSKAKQSSQLSIRPLTADDIEPLEEALGELVDRKYLVHWVSEAIRDVVRMPLLPTARETRNGLLHVIREGHRWTHSIDNCPGVLLFVRKDELDELKAAISRFSGQLEHAARLFAQKVQPGHPRTPFALEAFLDRMIGIAKKARVLPRVPARALRSQTAPRLPPAFFNFVTEALTIARDVIRSSSLPDDRKEAALAVLRVQSNQALSKLLVRLRGRIGKYRESKHGLVEW